MIVVDRGHRHSSGATEVFFWFHQPPSCDRPAPHEVDREGAVQGLPVQNLTEADGDVAEQADVQPTDQVATNVRQENTTGQSRVQKRVRFADAHDPPLPSPRDVASSSHGSIVSFPDLQPEVIATAWVETYFRRQRETLCTDMPEAFLNAYIAEDSREGRAVFARGLAAVLSKSSRLELLFPTGDEIPGFDPSLATRLVLERAESEATEMLETWALTRRACR